jgi:D-proline reductase (dithiol) PrdB
VGLIAREIEAVGISTLCMTSALSITRSVNPPRAVFLDFPLGHTTGKPHDPALQREILLDALEGFESLREPGSVKSLPYEWAGDDSWKESVMRPSPNAANVGASDDRRERSKEPQYQSEHDRELAEDALARGECETCVFLGGG